ncbi:methyltransferase domain-containing protein [Microbacterium sp. 4R-513]|uniref:methyltransferase domain-containing protein n=1 Tax=Microbacterium sp. 4R-513 TaxID=2567934 RepID=UPI0013E1E345|nr:methyltransferase domain-containing protein [Microbacterium sp. 4R-513]
MTLRARDTVVVELMDDPDCDPARLAATLRRFDVVNRLWSGWSRLYRSRLGPFLGSLDRPARVLDLGSGGGDLVARLSRLAERDGLDVRWIGADPDPRALDVARERASSRIEFRATDASSLGAAGERFDAVLSNNVLHHLGADELAAFAADSRALSDGIVLHSDIRRSRAAYGLYAIAVTPFAPGTFLRTDGLRSIRRSYHADELAGSLGAPWRVTDASPFRIVAEARAGGGAASDGEVRVEGASADAVARSKAASDAQARGEGRAASDADARVGGPAASDAKALPEGAAASTAQARADG